MYILDSREKNDPRDIDRFPLSHRKLSRFRVGGKACTGTGARFSGPYRMDTPWDDSEDLVEIARGKFKEAEGARERPDAIEYLSVTVSPLRYIAADPRFTFVGTQGSYTQSGIPCGNIGFPTLLGVLCVGLCCNEDLKKPLPRFSLTNLMMEPFLCILRCLFWASSGGTTVNNAGRRAARAFSSSSESSGVREISKLLAWTGANLCCAVHASRGAGSRRAPDSSSNAALSLFLLLSRSLLLSLSICSRAPLPRPHPLLQRSFPSLAPSSCPGGSPSLPPPLSHTIPP